MKILFDVLDEANGKKLYTINYGHVDVVTPRPEVGCKVIMDRIAYNVHKLSTINVDMDYMTYDVTSIFGHRILHVIFEFNKFIKETKEFTNIKDFVLNQRHIAAREQFKGFSMLKMKIEPSDEDIELFFKMAVSDRYNWSEIGLL